MARPVAALGEIEKEFTNQLVSKLGTAVEKVILFGSRAKGLAKPWSDYDLLIVMARRNQRLINVIYDLVTDFQLDHGADISLKIYTADDFAKKISLPTPFMQRIQKTGVTLWSQTPGR